MERGWYMALCTAKMGLLHKAEAEKHHCLYKLVDFDRLFLTRKHAPDIVMAA